METQCIFCETEIEISNIIQRSASVQTDKEAGNETVHLTHLLEIQNSEFRTFGATTTQEDCPLSFAYELSPS
jgi:hypothetical protein